MRDQKEKTAVTREIQAYIRGFSKILDFDPDTPIRLLSPFISDINDAIYELENGNFQKVHNHLHWLKLTVAMGDAQRRGAK